METVIRRIFLSIALVCAGLLGFASILQAFFGLVPCPLCILQRLFYLVIGLVALSAYFSWPRGVGTRAYGAVILVLSVLGGAVAARQVWLQHFPPVTDLSVCPVSFGSFIDTALVALGGVGNCVTRTWIFFGLALPEWSLILFIFLATAGVWLVRRDSRISGTTLA